MRLPADDDGDSLYDALDRLAAEMGMVIADALLGPAGDLLGPAGEHDWVWHVNEAHAIAKCRVCEVVRMWNGDELDVTNLLDSR